jgi:hypothetical protein
LEQEAPSVNDSLDLQTELEPRMMKRVFLAALWTGLLLVLCLLPGRFLHEPRTGAGISHLDKVVHAGLFAGFSLLWLSASRSPRRMAFVLIGGFVLAVATELAQSLPAIARDTDPLDALADVAGVFIGWALERGLAVRAVRAEPLQASSTAYADHGPLQSGFGVGMTVSEASPSEV